MPRSKCGHLLRQFQAEATIAQRSEVPIDEVGDHLREIHRRQFLTGSIGLGAAFVLAAAGCSSSPSAGPPAAPSPSTGPDSASQLRVAVVGAGLAGLTCAHRLARAGANVSVCDAASRVEGGSRQHRSPRHAQPGR